MATEIIVWNSFEKIFKTYVNMIFFEKVEISIKIFEVTCKYEYFFKNGLEPKWLREVRSMAHRRSIRNSIGEGRGGRRGARRHEE